MALMVPLLVRRSILAIALLACVAQGGIVRFLFREAAARLSSWRSSRECDAACQQRVYARADTFLEKFDKDNDGYLKEGEYVAMLQALFGGPHEEEAKREYAKMCGYQNSKTTVGVSLAGLRFVFQHAHFRDALQKRMGGDL
mmetsp:Transcript_55580/g.129389  ORF Transcript_55580/g.129389 Transcript_55580/m.129389 type:complete len:142 (-) Transcript_55580:95-520(-)|eukprot:CAMPEP_0171107078 /NCGR_PEP_ID=MMETSP0766_2-20121228/66097_1 /TAXON_ID=439317 /ORGANISM="Gambierdiscus australes, Strain CAWD 149" /LENGTH=141 /DNA_ID=CAMNT_0011568307 /DNA_START=61 /DNA_END=486 /DNA_ORIENTATION=-